MALDLGGGYGAEGAVQGLQQLLAQRQAMRAYADQQQQQQTDNAFKQQQLAQQDALTRASIAERLQAAQGAHAQQRAAEGQHLADTVPAGTIMGMQDPGVATMQQTGFGSLVPTQNTLPSTQTQGDIGAGAASQTAQQPSQYGYLKTASSKQQEDAAKLAEKVAEDAQKAAAKANEEPLVETIGANGKPVYTRRSQAEGQTPYVKPTAEQTVTIQTVDDQGNPVTRIVPKTAGSSFAGRPNATTDRQTRAATFAQGDLEDLTRELEAADKAGLLGPGAGRLGTFLTDQVGSSGDPAVDAQYGGLKAAIKGINTSYPMAMTGSMRSGGGGVDRLNNLLNSGKFSADQMRGAIKVIAGELARRSGKSDSGGGAKPNQIHYDANGVPIK